MESKSNVTHQRTLNRFLLPFSISILMLLITLPVDCEQIRGKVVHSLEIDDDYESVSEQIGLRELTSIGFATNEYLNGIVVSILAPDTVLQFRESFLLSMYSDITPTVSFDPDRFSGRKIFSRAFPINRRTYIDLRLDSSTVWKKSTPGSIFLQPSPDSAGYPLLFSIDPVMKGIPSHISSSVFTVTLTPVLADKGSVSLNFVPDQVSSDFAVFIDGKQVSMSAEKIYLPTGIHSIEIRCDGYLPFTQSFGIDQANTTFLDIDLQPATSFVQFDAPEDAVVFLDGQQIKTGPTHQIETVPGDHVVLVRIGEYSVSKKIELEGGKNYKVSLFFDILVNDN